MGNFIFRLVFLNVEASFSKKLLFVEDAIYNFSVQLCSFDFSFFIPFIVLDFVIDILVLKFFLHFVDYFLCCQDLFLHLVQRVLIVILARMHFDEGNYLGINLISLFFQFFHNFFLLYFIRFPLWLFFFILILLLLRFVIYLKLYHEVRYLVIFLFELLFYGIVTCLVSSLDEFANLVRLLRFFIKKRMEELCVQRLLVLLFENLVLEFILFCFQFCLIFFVFRICVGL